MKSWTSTGASSRLCAPLKDLRGRALLLPRTVLAHARSVESAAHDPWRSSAGRAPRRRPSARMRRESAAGPAPATATRHRRAAPHATGNCAMPACATWARPYPQASLRSPAMAPPGGRAPTRQRGPSPHPCLAQQRLTGAREQRWGCAAWLRHVHRRAFRCLL